MRDIGNIGSSGSLGAAGITPSARSTGEAHTRRVADATSATARPTGDRVELSEVARWLGEMNLLPAVREDKVAAARAAIANGSLDSDEKLAIAVQRMIDDVM